MPAARAMRAVGVRAASRARIYAMWHPDGAVMRAVPASLRSRWRLDPPPPGSRRIEVGSGFSPRPGYLHVDIDPRLPVDVVVSGAELPFPSAWGDELLSVHMLEHVPPPHLRSTLRRWHEVLVPGGRLTVHTPNAAALAAVVASAADGDGARFWAATNALYGYGYPPWSSTGPEQLSAVPDHKVALTFPVLRGLLVDAGFVDVADVTGQDPTCHHTRDWADYVPDLCLEVTARRAP